MPKQTVTQKHSDNPYFHKDFHIAFSYTLDYVYRKFGKKAVREYLRQFSRAYYAPLKRAIKERGLLAVKEHYEKVYKIEGARFEIRFSQDELFLHLLTSPAIIHIKANGHPVSRVFRESVANVIKTICQDTPYDAEMLEYHEDNGAYLMRFFRRPE
jgi:hypothetical protein